MARLLIHLIEPDGDIIFDGMSIGSRDGLSVRSLRSRMQMVFQDSYASLNPRMPIVKTALLLDQKQTVLLIRMLSNGVSI